MQDLDHEFKPVNVRPDFDLIQDTPDIIFKCTGCGQEATVKPTDIDLSQGGESNELEVAYYLAKKEHTCPAGPHPDLDDAPVDLPLEPETFAAGHFGDKEVGTPIRYILTTAEADAVLTDPNIVGLSPFFEDVTEAKATAAPYRARVWRLEEV